LARGHGDEGHDAIAILEHLNGRTVEAMEKVNDEQYRP
jgi:hypothetical protein